MELVLQNPCCMKLIQRPISTDIIIVNSIVCLKWETSPLTQWANNKLTKYLMQNSQNKLTNGSYILILKGLIMRSDSREP